jgi:tetratricopeptide (TPR) repeat protein
VRRTDRPDLAVAVAGGNADALLRLADLLKADGRYPDLANKARAEAASVLQAACDKPDASAATLASLAGLRRANGEHAAAITLYRRALLLHPDSVEWRLELARSLADSGNSGEALREAELCVRMGGRTPQVEELINRLSPAGRGGPDTRGQ